MMIDGEFTKSLRVGPGIGRVRGLTMALACCIVGNRTKSSYVPMMIESIIRVNASSYTRELHGDPPESLGYHHMQKRYG